MLEGTIDGAVLGVATAILGVAGICVGVKLKEKITKSPPSDSLAAIPFLALYAVKMGFEYGSYIGSTYGLAKTVYQIYK
ncbi:MAG: hypothetical protein K0S74_819 [Chlamydiales bacterium]|jgi:hypothetical protein|nr:hypothetical protein [Chlamydiales bacterium]